jgi:signal peptidase I
MENLKKRRPIIALFLSFVIPGLGQMYNGQIRKGIILHLTALLLVLIFCVLSGINFYAMISSLALLICYWLFFLFEAFYSSIKLKKIILKPYNRWYFYIIIAIIIASISNFVDPLFSSLIRNNIVQAYKMPASSMVPTLLVGDHFLVSKFIYGIKIPLVDGKLFVRSPDRGDIIVFVYPRDKTKDFIKRVIGLPGEKIQIVGKEILVNDVPMEDPWGKYETNHVNTGSVRDKYGPHTVPPDSLFVMGDNRDNSQDSRYFGFVGLNAVKGKALYIYWSKDRSRIGTEIR